MTIPEATNHGSVPSRENRTMNMLQFLFGRAVRARRPRAEILSPPSGQPARRADGSLAGKRNATMQGRTPLRSAAAIASALVLCAFAPQAARAIDISAGGTVQQNFDSIGTAAAATLPTGWKTANEAAQNTRNAYSAAGTATTNRAGNNMSVSAANGVYNLGAGDAATATDRAVGYLSSSSASRSGNLFVYLTNNGATTITNLVISYNVELYRGGTAGGTNSFRLFCATNGSSWSYCGSVFSNRFDAVATNRGYASAPGSTVSVTNQNLPVTVAAASTIYLVWNYSAAANSHGMGIDDVTIFAQPSAATPSIAIADNGTVSAANVATGTVNQVLIKISAAVTTANATLNTFAFTTAGTYDANDLTNLKLWYSTDSTLDAGSDSTLGTLSSPAAAGAKSFTGLSQTINSGSTGYFFITADVAGSATYGNTVSINAIANGDLTFASGTVSGGPTSAGGAQTFVSAAPTSNGSVGSFSGVTSSGMTVNWTSGNGERRIVVVKAGGATSWTPTDGTAPSGVNADFSSAADQGSGNKICYDGTGTSFALSGLSASTTYYVTIFEYNGTTTYVKYYTAGTEAGGSQATSASGCATQWTAMHADNRGTPVASYYVGDLVPYLFKFALNTETSPFTVSYGLGKTTDGVSWSWYGADWSYQDGDNRYWTSDDDAHVFTSSGNWYYAGRFVNGGCTYYAMNDWTDANSSLTAVNYFSVAALTDPAVGTVTATASAITLNWTRWNSKDVMVVRSTDDSFTAPTGGQAYSVNDTIGDDTVIYNGSGTSVEDGSRTAGTTYSYKLYSVNNSYYSSGASTSKITIPATPGTITGDATVCSGASGETYTIDAVTGATGYTWTVPSGASITAGDGTTSITVTFGSSAGNVTVTADNGSGSSSAATKAITIATVPAQPGTITGNATVCSGASGETYSISAVGGATGYTWSVPSGASITAGSGTTEITVTFGSSSGDVSVTADNDCGSGTARTLAVTVNSAPAAPTVSAESSVTSSGFTANWEAASGASEYRLDVMTSVGSGGALLIDEDFTSFSDWTDGGTAADADSGHYGVGSPCRALGAADTLTSPSVNYPTQMTFYVDASSGGNNMKTTNYYSLNGGDTWTPIGVYTSTTTGATIVQPLNSSPNLSSSTGVTFRFVSAYNTWYLDDVVVTGGGGTPTYVEGWQDVDVDNVLTYPVTGLEADSTYYYRVRAVNGCGTSESSTAEEVTTSAGTPDIALADNDAGQTAAGNVSQGATSHVLATFKLTVTTAAATLNSVAIATSGYDADDLDNLKLWYNTSSSFGGSAISTLTDPGVAGTETFASLSQELAIGTHYFFITADVDASATVNHTIQVAAMDTDDLAYAAGNETGGPTTAGGAQTVVGVNDMTMASADGESTTISSLENDASVASTSDGAQAWQVTFSNPSVGLGDGTITALTITQGAANEVAGWSSAIQAAALFDGDTHLANATIGASSLSFSGLSTVVSDGGAKTLTLRISLKSTAGALADNAIFEFKLEDSDVTVSGNGVTTEAIDSDQTKNAIAVAATKLAFSSIAGSTKISTGFGATVQAQDANGNVDLDSMASVALSIHTGTGNLSSVAGLAQSLSSGVHSWTDLQLDASGTFTLKAAATGLTDGISSAVTVTMAYGGTGNFTNIVDLVDLADGYYVIVGATNVANATNAMTCTNAGTFFTHSSVTNTDGVVVDPDPEIVWLILTNATYGGFTIFNEASNVYASYSGSANAAYAVEAVGGTTGIWTFTENGGLFTCVNKATPGRKLQYNSGSPRFAAYESDLWDFALFKIMFSYDNDSDIVRDADFTETAIAYGSFQEDDLTTAAKQVGQFTIRDGGATAGDVDTQGTTLNSVAFTVANWENLKRLAIYSGTTEIAEVAVTGATVEFGNLGLTAADGGTATFKVLASFQSTVGDNEQLQFTIASAKASSFGSTFAAADASRAATDTTDDRNRIMVEATKLMFSSQPTGSVYAGIDFAATVQAQDALGSLDVDSTVSVTLGVNTGSGALSSTTGPTKSLVAGEYAWTDLRYDTVGDFTLDAEDGAAMPLTTGVSDTITAIAAPILAFDFAGLAGNEATAGSDYNHPNLTDSTISRGVGLSAAENLDSFNGSTWSVGSIANAVASNDYMEFTITPDSGYMFNVNSLTLNFQRTLAGPVKLALRSSVNGYATDLHEVKSVTDSTNTQSFTFTFTQDNSPYAVTYRLYAYAESTSGEGAIGCGSGYDLMVFGAVTPAEPPDVVLADNGTQVAAASVTVGTPSHVLHKFQITVSESIATLNAVALTTTGSFGIGDLANLKLWHSADATFESAGDETLGTYAYPGGAGAISFTGLSELCAVGTRYFFVTADVGSGAAPAHTVGVAAMAGTDLTFASVDQRTGTTASGLQTIVVNEPTVDSTSLVFTNVMARQMTLSWTPGNGAYRIAVVSQGDAPTWAPTDGVAPSGISASYATATDKGNGDKVCFNGAGSSFNLTGLQAGTTYYVKIYEYNGSGSYVNYLAGGTPLAGNQTTKCVDFPTLLYASATNATDFTAAWAAVADADGYVLDVSLYEDFGDAGGSALLSENFNTLTAGTPPSGWTSSKGSDLLYSILFGDSSPAFAFKDAGQTLTSPTFDSGATNVVFWTRGNSGGSSVISVSGLVSGVWTRMGAVTNNTTGANYNVALDSGTTQLKFAFETDVVNSSLDDIVVQGGVGSYVSGYEHKAVAGTSQSVAGLDPDTTYYFRVAATDGAACTSDYAAVATVTTVPAEPTAQLNITSLVPTSSDGGTLTATWECTSGEADGTIILVRSAADARTAPTDLAAYTAVNTAGTIDSGSDVGSGNHVKAFVAGTSGSLGISLGNDLGEAVTVAVYPYNGPANHPNFGTAVGSWDEETSVPLAAPEASSATADGNTLVRLVLTNDPTASGIVVYNKGSAPTAVPNRGGGTIGLGAGTGTIIYQGAYGALDHVVDSGSTHYYAFYRYELVSGEYWYSAAAEESVSTPAFYAAEIVDTFSYTNETTMASRAGEHNWNGAWSGDTGDFTVKAISFSEQEYYPKPTGNKVLVSPAANTTKQISRSITNKYSTVVYAAYIVNFQYGGSDKWVGAYLMEDGVNKVYFGEMGGQDQKLGVHPAGGSHGGGTTLSAGTGNDYVVILKYDISADHAYVSSFQIGTESIPEDEPASWDVDYDNVNADGGGFWINGIKLEAGGGTDVTPGNVYFDEVRMGGSWTDVTGGNVVDAPNTIQADVDGAEMVVLKWNNRRADNVVVLWDDAPIAVANLTDSTPYAVNDAVGDATVVYNGSAEAHVEHVVPIGSTNYYRLFGRDGTTYSPTYGEPCTNPVVTLTYEDGEIVDAFAYTNGFTLAQNGLATGQGWNAGWTGDTSDWKVDDTNLLTGAHTGYPEAAANKLQWEKNSADVATKQVVRSLASARAGRTFVAFMLNYKVGDNTASLQHMFAGLSLMSTTTTDNDTEEIFFGKLNGQDHAAGINYAAGAEPDVETVSSPTYTLNAAHFADYMIVGEWDPAIKTVRLWAFSQYDDHEIPQEYTNATPIAVYSNESLAAVGTITGIRLAAGITDAGVATSLDHVYFDEVRVGGTWDEVLNFNYPDATAFWAGSVINGQNYVTDGELAEDGKSWPIGYTTYHRSGVTQAWFQIITDIDSTNGLYAPPVPLRLDPADTEVNDHYRDFTNMVAPRIDTNDVVLGDYTSRVWMVSTSGKATNSLYMEGREGASDLFFGEFGEGRLQDKYVEIYNGSGGPIDLSQYMIAKQTYGGTVFPDYTKPWDNWCRLTPEPYYLDHGKTILILNGETVNYTTGTLDEMTNALRNADPPLDFLITTNNALQVSGNDPVGLFKVGDSNNWIDMCGLSPNSGTGSRYIMTRMEDAEVPRPYPLLINTNEWFYRDWAQDPVYDAPTYTNFLTTAGAYDLLIGLGGFITFTVVDDDADVPRLQLDSLRPTNGILAQYRYVGTGSTAPTLVDAANAVVGPLRIVTTAAVTGTPDFVEGPTAGYYAATAGGWQDTDRFWALDLTPAYDLTVTNLAFQAQLTAETAPTAYEIQLYSGGEAVGALGPYDLYPAPVDTSAWYAVNRTLTFDLTAGADYQIRVYPSGATGEEAAMRMYDLTLSYTSGDTNGVVRVTDADLAGSGSYEITGSAWDPDSGIVTAANPDDTKRPTLTLQAPNGAAAIEGALGLSAAIADGDAWTPEEGAFTNTLPAASYTNIMMGSYAGTATLWDHDSDRADDPLSLTANLVMYVVDNDVQAPGTVGVVRVNGVVATETAPTRYEAAWSNTPEILITFDQVAEDADPGAAYPDEQRVLSGVGEYRVATNENINTLSAGNRAALGTPFPVATTNGALANYGFESPGAGWTLDGNSAYRSLALGGTNEVKEGTNSLRQVDGGVARQTIEFRNLAAEAPIVGVIGWYRSDTLGGPTLRIEAFATNNLTTPVATRNVQPGTAAAWTSFSAEPAALGNGTVELLKVSLIDGGGNTTFWDDIRLSVGIDTNLPTMRFVAGAANQGLNPQYLFAVDADNNRIGDKLAGPAAPFYIAYDVTLPTKVGTNLATRLSASTDAVDDPTTQFDLAWGSTGVGPDDPSHANHPTKAAADRDLLSPWQTYKIYYNPFDPLDVPAEDPGPGNGGAYIFTNFIATGAYQAWSNRTWASEIADPGAPDYQPNYHALTNAGRSTIRLYDLDFDQEYAVVIVGVDKAGNEGPAGVYSWATNNTIKFALTRGWTLSKNEAKEAFPAAGSLANTNTDTAAGLAWLAAGQQTNGVYANVTKEYDLIYWDGATFQENTNNKWNLLGTVKSNWFVDDGGFAQPRGKIRFYRASYKDRWRTTRQYGTNVVSQRPLASEEVYALHNIVLSPGQNFVAFHGVPYTNTFACVFGGLENFPGGTTMSPESGATVVEFFSAGTNAPLADLFWLDQGGRWRTEGGTDVTDAVQPPDFFNRGFSITLPPAGNEVWTTYRTANALDYGQSISNRVVPALTWPAIAQVPTNALGFSQTIHCGSRHNPFAPVYNVVSLRLPVSAHPSQMKLLDCGFVKGIRGQSDEIYTMDTAVKAVLSGSTIYCDTNSVWRFVGSNGLVPWGYFKPNDVIVIVSKNGDVGNTWTWTYRPTDFYALPTRSMGF